MERLEIREKLKLETMRAAVKRGLERSAVGEAKPSDVLDASDGGMGGPVMRGWDGT